MTTKQGTYASGTIVNADGTNAASGAAIIATVVAEAPRRTHLVDGIVSVQWDRERGVGILVDNAGQRQHLANALKFDPAVWAINMRALGQGYARGGTLLGHDVTIWNVEA